MIRLFFDGGVYWMSLLTLELIGLFLAAWKAPAWVKEIGIIALMTGVIGTVVGFSQICTAVAQQGPMPAGVILSGVKVALIAVIYGILIYILSLILRIVQKPRL